MATDAGALEGRVPGVGGVGILRRAGAFVAAHPVWAVFLLALAIRIAVAVGLAIAQLQQHIAPDGAVYSLLASTKANGHTATWDWFDHFLWQHDAALLWPVTWLYAIFGTHQLVGQLYLTFLGAGAAALTTRLAVEFLPLRWALVAGLIVALLPTQIVWSSLILKDAAVWFSLSGLAVIVALAGRAEGMRLLVLGLVAVALLVLLGYLRYQTLIVAAWALMLASPFGARTLRLRRVGAAVAIGVLLPWIVFSLGPAGLTYVQNSRPPTDVRAWNAVGASSAISTGVAPIVKKGGGYYVQVPSKTTKGEGTSSAPASSKPPPTGAASPGPQKNLVPATSAATRAASDSSSEVGADVKHLPRGLLAMLVQPFPWQSGGSTSLNLARLVALIWYPLLLLGVIGLVGLRPRHLRVMAFPLLAGGAILLLYALTEGNLGTALRHRGEFEWVIALLAGFGLARLVAWRERHSFTAAGRDAATV